MRAGETACCGKLNLCDPRAVEIAAMCGYDCVWLCMEHVPNTLEQVENQIRAAKIYNVDAMVRVQRGGYSDLIHPLEMDAAGIMVPHVMGAADAAQVARTTRFHPVGRRPVDGGNADGAYCAIPLVEYMRQANEQRFVAIQIEDPEPLDELDRIAATDGIDMLFFGPADFSQGIGAPGRFDDPRIGDARDRVLEAARRHGKFAGTVAGTPEGFKVLADQGFNFLSIGADVVCLMDYFSRIVSGVNGAMTAETASVYQQGKGQ
ncbi:MAG: aldolase [Kiritimatiellae bacterium]|nr:aldolase [Kiritimatiellia bacterium]